MKVGFTGTQQGMTDKQARTFRDLLKKLGVKVFHHGDCVGADDKAHDLVRAYRKRIKIVIHPPKDAKKRVFREGDETRSEKEYITRNHDIVDETEVLIATSFEFEEQLRSGTWATVRYAKKQRKPVYLILPDGSLED